MTTAPAAMDLVSLITSSVAVTTKQQAPTMLRDRFATVRTTAIRRAVKQQKMTLTAENQRQGSRLVVGNEMETCD